MEKLTFSNGMSCEPSCYFTVRAAKPGQRFDYVGEFDDIACACALAEALVRANKYDVIRVVAEIRPVIVFDVSGKAGA